MQTEKQKIEVRALRLSAYGSLLVGCVAVVFSLVSHSSAILLDGLFNLGYFIMGLFALKVSGLLARGETEKYPLGYAYYEPLTNGIKGVLVSGISAMAMIDALITLFSGGRELLIGLATAYGLFASITCWLIALLLQGKSKKADSPLVSADAKNWVLNAAVSSGVLITFVGVWLIRGTSIEFLAAYVDQILVLAITLMFISIPIKMAWQSLLQLLNRTPDRVVDEIRQAITEVTENLPLEEIFIRVIEPGRSRKILVHLVLPEDFYIGELAKLDVLRGKIFDKLSRQHNNVACDILFTTEHKWGAFLAEPEMAA